MAYRACGFCQGVGTTRDGHACTYCGGYGKDPYARDDAPTPAGPRVRGRSDRLPWLTQFVISVLAIIVGFTVYNLNGATDAAQLQGFAAFFGVMFTGYVVMRFLRNLVQLLVLGVILFGIDLFFFDGAKTPRAGTLLSTTWEHARDAFLP